MGRTAADNRLFVNGVLWILRSGARWYDLPERYGKYKSVHKRFVRWAHSGVWDRVFEELVRDRNRLLSNPTALNCRYSLARADGSLRHPLARLSRIDVLVIDDWAMAPLNESERREIWEICEDRYQTRSTILTSQMPVSRWHEQIGDPTIADGILDRLVHNAHRIEMRGESMRKKQNPPQDEKRE